MLKTISLVTLVFFIALSLGCSSIALDQDKSYSEALPINNETEFGRYSDLWKGVNGNKSGFLPVVQGMDALG